MYNCINVIKLNLKFKKLFDQQTVDNESHWYVSSHEEIFISNDKKIQYCVRAFIRDTTALLSDQAVKIQTGSYSTPVI